MCDQREERAIAVRARWMAELAATIDSAQRVAWQLGSASSGCVEARELYRQLEAAKIELEALRGVTRMLREEIDPWLVEQLGWPAGLEGPERPERS